MIYRRLADLVVVAHLAFIAFAVLGGLLVNAGVYGWVLWRAKESDLWISSEQK